MDLIYRYDPFQPVGQKSIADAAAACDALRSGNDRFAEIVRRMQERTLGAGEGEPLIIAVSPVSLGLPLLPGLAQQQTPFALVLGCSDARAPVEAIFDQSFNDLFVVRIAGNVLGTECLGSVDYAVRNLGNSLKVVVVLGHSGCGAVTAAVDGYLSPRDFVDIAFTHSLRSLVDRIQIAVRGAANALRQVGGKDVESLPEYRDLLIEASVYLNAAITAFDLRREIRLLGNATMPIVYGIYDLASTYVRSLPIDRRKPKAARPDFGEAPRTSDEFASLAVQLAERLLGAVESGSTIEW